jgi:molybdate-binding protein/DNA-binding PadR family transcriptional regulator
MTVAHAVLGVLARGEGYGYELRRRLADELGAEWGLDFGQLYRTLGTLTRNGWVDFRVEAGQGGPARKVYRLLPAGRRELQRWLRHTPPTPARRRDHRAARARLCALVPERNRAAAEPLVALGSDDLVLDLLARHLAQDHPQIHFAAQPVGSLSGLIALHERRAQLAGIHLLDTDTGEYNIPYVKHLLPGERVVLINLARREQGLMVAAGNPKGIRGLGDLTRRDVGIVNRQAGAGTRLLLHHQLRQARIDTRRIAGYAREVPTHGAVAAAVAAGTADAGPGVRAVALAHGLDFLPLGEERYDLVVPQAIFESPRLRPLLALLHDTSFRRAAARFPGYDVTNMSRVIATLG